MIVVETINNEAVDLISKIAFLPCYLLGVSIEFLDS